MKTIQLENELLKVVESSGLELQTSNNIRDKFLPFFEQAEDWRQKAESLVVTDVSQVREMKMAREARLALKNIRVDADKTRKALKEESLRYGKAVQGVYNVIAQLIAPIEKHLEDQEKFAEVQEAKRKAELKAIREKELIHLEEFVPFGLDLGDMTEEDYQKVLKGAESKRVAKIEEEKKAEEERIAQAEEQKRIRLENERLKAEAAEKEKARAEERARMEAEARKEREAAEANLRAEREAKAKLEAELKAKAEEEARKAEEEARLKREAEEKAATEIKAQQEAERKAKAAPDKAKLIEFAKVIEEMKFPEVKSDEAKRIVDEAEELLSAISGMVRLKSEEL